jgi:hypothetical protein
VKAKSIPPSQEVETKAEASRQKKNPKLSSVRVSADGSWGGEGEETKRIPSSKEVETKAVKLVVRKKNLYDLCVYQLKEAGGRDKENPPFTGGRDQGGS